MPAVILIGSQTQNRNISFPGSPGIFAFFVGIPVQSIHRNDSGINKTEKKN